MICYKCKTKISSTPNYGLHASCFREWFGIESDHFESIVERKEEASKDEVVKKYGDSFFAGAFKKYTATCGSFEYILKIQTEEYPELPVVEFCSNLIAKNLKIDVPPYFLILFNDVPAFVTRNMLSGKSGVQLFHLSNYMKKADPFSFTKILEIIKERTGRYLYMKKFVDICLFDMLIGNHDRHGRNIALIQNKKGLTLSQFYDNPSFIGLQDDFFISSQLDPRGRVIIGDNSNPGMKDYILAAIEEGFEDTVKGFYGRINLYEIDRIIDNSFLKSAFKEKFKLLIKERYEEFTSVLD